MLVSALVHSLSDVHLNPSCFEALAAMKECNIQQYGRPEGPTPEQLFEKYGSWDEGIFSSGRSSPAMDVLTGLYKHKED